MREKLLRITILFFSLMVCFTILSRAAYQEGTAVVKVGRPESRTISHSVSAAGKIEVNQELAIVTEQDQRVTAVCVQEGQKVAAGEVLFEIDRKLLDEKILAQKQEMEKQRLQMEDLESGRVVSGLRRANELAQAQENYSLNVERANAQLSRAARDLNNAKKALKKSRKDSGSTQAEGEVELQLEKTLEEKQEAYIQAQQELTSLQWRIEQAVSEALLQRGSALPETEESVRTQASDFLEEDTILLFEEEDFITDGDPWYSGDRSGESLTQGTGIMSGESLMQGAETMSEESLILEEEMESGESLVSDSEMTSGQDAGYVPLTDEDRDLLADPGREGSLTQEEYDQIEQSIRAKYREELGNARDKVERAKEEMEAAEAALAQYQTQQLETAGTEDAQVQQQLAAAVQAARDAYIDASIAANEAAVTGGRAVQTASLPEASDSSGRIGEIAYEQSQLILEKLENLKEQEGKICAPSDGLVTRINLMTGEKTSDTTAMLLADLSRGYHFLGEISKEQEKYIGTGDPVTITIGNKKKKLEEIPVSSIRADESEEGNYFVTVQLPDDSAEPGTSARLDFTKKSQNYPVCVPLSALRLDEKNQPFVLVPEEYETIMGIELRARKVAVTVLEQNEQYAALAEGNLSGQEDIILQSDKAVTEGSRVRIAE